MRRRREKIFPEKRCEFNAIIYILPVLVAKVSEMYKIHEPKFQGIRGGNIDRAYFIHSRACTINFYRPCQMSILFERGTNNSFNDFQDLHVSCETSILPVLPSVESPLFYSDKISKRKEVSLRLRYSLSQNLSYVS